MSACMTGCQVRPWAWRQAGRICRTKVEGPERVGSVQDWPSLPGQIAASALSSKSKGLSVIYRPTLGWMYPCCLL